MGYSSSSRRSPSPRRSSSKHGSRRHESSSHHRDRDRDRDRERDHRSSSRRSRERGSSKSSSSSSSYSHHRSSSKRRSRSRSPRPRSGSRQVDRHSSSSGWKSEKKKQYRFDSPPRTTDSAEEQQKKILQQQLGAGAAIAGTGLVGTVAPSAAFSGPASSLALDAAATKAARELYVGNLPPSLEVPQLMEFLNAAMAAVGGSLLPGPPAVKAWRSTDGHYAFVEFRTMEEASNGMQLNGLNCMGYNLRIGRPKTYPQEMNHLIPPPTIPLLHPQGVFSGLSPAQPGISALGLGSLPGSVPMGIGALNAGLSGSTTGGTGAVAAAAIPSVGASVAAGAGAGAGVSNASPATAVASNPQAALAAARMVAHGMAGAATQKDDKNQQPERLCILDLPPIMSEEKVRQLVETFGPVNAFHLLKKDDGSEMVCIVEYMDLESQQQAMEILHSNSPYRVLLAEEAIQQEVIAPFFKKAKLKTEQGEEDEEDAAEGEKMSAQALLRPQVCTRVLLLSNIVEIDDLLDDKEYEDIVEDIRLECEECGGPVLSVKIPRPVRGFEHESDPAFQKQQKEVKEESGESQPSPAPAVPPTVKKEENSDEKPVKNEQQDGGASDQAKTEEGEPGTREEEKPATVGFAYVEFEDCEWSAKARKALNGRKFAGKIVEAHYFSEVKFRKECFHDPKPNFIRSHSSLYNKSLAYAGPRREPKVPEEEDEDAATERPATASAVTSPGGNQSTTSPSHLQGNHHTQTGASDHTHQLGGGCCAPAGGPAGTRSVPMPPHHPPPVGVPMGASAGAFPPPFVRPPPVGAQPGAMGGGGYGGAYPNGGNV